MITSRDTVQNTPPNNTPAPVSLWTAFSIPMFRAIWIAAFVSNVGTWMQNMAGVWLLTTLSQSQVLVALMQTATSLPVFLLSVPAGALADLFDRRKLLMLTQGFMSVVAIILGVVTLRGAAGPESILGFTFLLGIGAALNAPAWQAITPEVVPRSVLPTALTLNGISINLSRAIGPAVGGLIIAYYSPALVFLFNGVSFIGTFFVIQRWKRQAVTSSVPVEDFFTALAAGIRYVRFSPALHAILIRAFAFTFGASAMWALLSLVVARQLKADSGTYGLMLTWLGAGAVTAALLVNRINERLSPDRRVLIALLAFSGVNIALALVKTVSLLYPVMFIGGMAWLLVMTSLNVSMQLHLPKWVQARVLSIYLLIFQGGMALGSVVWGWISSHYGIPAALLAAAGWLLLSMLLAIPFRLPIADKLDLTPARDTPHPPVSDAISPDRGPVVVMVEYRVEPHRRDDFLLAMEEMRRLRRRDGALRGGIFADPNDPTRQVEFFTVASWGEHLRQHQRFTKEDLRIQERVLEFHAGPDRPTVSHFIAEPEVTEQHPAGLNEME